MGGGGVFCNFGFGLRERKLEIWIFGMGGYSVTSDLDLGEKVRGKSWKFGFFGGYSGGGKKYSVTSDLDLDLGKEVGNLDFWDGGVFCNFGFGLREGKVGNLDFGMGWGGKKVFCNFGFGIREKSWKFGFFGMGGGYSGKVMEKKKKKPTLQKN